MAFSSISINTKTVNLNSAIVVSDCFITIVKFQSTPINCKNVGLQIRLAQFDSGSRLQNFGLNFFLIAPSIASTGLFCFTIQLCPSGEIGRHIGLKIRRFVNNGRTGSIPVSGTTIE